jgi:hypothetical protein
MRLKLLIVALVLVSAAPTFAQDKATPSARDYYYELKAANNFSHYKDIYVCFRDDGVPSFAVMSKGSEIIEEMKKVGETPSKEVLQAKNLLFVEIYYKGVPHAIQLFSPVAEKEGTDYDIQFKSPFHGRIIYSINWITGRYRMIVYALDNSKTLPADESSGKCELIHPNK